jgi:hypothetical protein
MEDPVKFKSVFTGTNYVPTQLDAGAGDVNPKRAAQRPMRIRAFTAAPIAEGGRP